MIFFSLLTCLKLKWIKKQQRRAVLRKSTSQETRQWMKKREKIVRICVRREDERCKVFNGTRDFSNGKFTNEKFTLINHERQRSREFRFDAALSWVLVVYQCWFVPGVIYGFGRSIKSETWGKLHFASLTKILNTVTDDESCSTSKTNKTWSQMPVEYSAAVEITSNLHAYHARSCFVSKLLHVTRCRMLYS